ncbi:MAG: hypothetical protein M1816_007893 [Peltula sp. TS41687]|nr:MAG: hypothetical protein M1816_007893 [Peltula sp. TS41687]
MATSIEKRLPRVPFDAPTTPFFYSGRDLSPPRTPPQPGKARRSSRAQMSPKVHVPARETFLDDSTPVDDTRVIDTRWQAERDSHELILRPRQAVRESLMDNMLLSLDRYETQAPVADPRSCIARSQTLDDVQLYGGLREGDLFDLRSRYRLMKQGHSKAHAYSSSYSSGYDAPDDEPTIGPRGQRSDSGSNVSNVIERTDGLGGADKERGRKFDSQRAVPPSPRPSAARRWSERGPRTGKSSVSSIDAGYVQLYGTTRWASTIGQQSARIDRPPRNPIIHNPHTGPFSDGHVSHAWSQPLPDLPYDAAPNPVIPGGPSRQHSPERPSSHARTDKRRPSQAQATASRSPYRRKSRADDRDTSNIKGQVPGRGEIQDVKGLPALPVYDDAPAPGPTVSFVGRPSPSIPESRGRTRERPGFFRRVFGSSKNNKSVPSRSAPAPSIPSRWDRERGDGTGDEGPSEAPALSGPLPGGRAGKALPAAPEQTPPLSKKSSSFFRRRKKSVSENYVAPSIPLKTPTGDIVEPVQQPPSPVSSLRKVMDPYIKTLLASPEKLDDHKELLPSRELLAIKSEEAIPLDYTVDQTDEFTGTTTSDTGDSKESRSKSAASKCPIRRRFASSSAQSPNGKADSGRDSKPAKDMDRGKIPTIDVKMPGSANVEQPDPPPVEDELQDPSKPAMKQTVETRASDTSTLQLSRSENYVACNHDSERMAGHIDDKKNSISTARQPAEGVNTAPKPSRVWLEPTASEENLTTSIPVDILSPSQLAPAKVSPSAESEYTTASGGPGPKTEDNGEIGEPGGPPRLAINIEGVVDLPTQETREQARKLYEGEDNVIDNQTVAAWLGEPAPARAIVRKAYLELFDWSNVSILTALRELCNSLALKAETQQVDRILDALSIRWCECNPNHGFKATGELYGPSQRFLNERLLLNRGTDVVHTICYSLLLLNTDLHVADIEQKMTRNQFIKNTLPTIRRVAEDAAPTAFEPANSSTLRRSRTSWIEYGTPNHKPSAEAGTWEWDESRPSFDVERRSRRTSYRPSQREKSRGRSPTPLGVDGAGEELTLLVKAPFQGTKKAWEAQIEVILKAFYHSIRQQRLPLRGAAVEPVVEQSFALNPLSLLAGNVLKRTPSTLSRAQSENFNPRGRSELQRLSSTGRWTSKNRSRPRVYPTSSAMGSSRTSFEDPPIWTPNSSTWSKSTFNKTQTSASLASNGSYFPAGDYQRSIGFANALSQAIIRDDAATSRSTDDRIASLLEDETLGLAGAPWAKEGIVQHKHHLDSLDKRAKDRNWNECFAVIEKGWMKLFSFSTKVSTIRQRNKMHRQAVGSMVVGGGNWTENAEGIGSFLLRQTIASALPPPGYSKNRPYVWALSLPTGAVHLFQVGTPEIVKEFVSTANYWSARLSKEPVVGGISNVEHGWSDAVINQVLTESFPPTSLIRPPSSSGGGPGRRPSFQSSLRSSIDHCNGGARQKLPGDRLMISDWNPPSQSMVASPLSEADQLQALTTYVHNIELELQRHNELRGPMSLAFSPRHSNANKAMTNWERKSSYLLREIVKFRTYIDCLTAAREREKEIHSLPQGKDDKDGRDDNGVVVESQKGEDDAKKSKGKAEVE